MDEEKGNRKEQNIHTHIGIDGRCVRRRRKMPRASDNPRGKSAARLRFVVVASNRACVKYPRHTLRELAKQIYVRFGARRFAITLVPRAERRFGVEREPVVTYARARSRVCQHSSTRPPHGNVGAAASVRGTADHRERTSERTGESLTTSLRPTVFSKNFRPGSSITGRDAPIEAQQLRAVASFAEAAVRACSDARPG